MKEFLDNYLPDKYLVRAALTLVALIILIPGVFGLGPPRWFGDEHDAVVIAARDKGQLTGQLTGQITGQVPEIAPASTVNDDDDRAKSSALSTGTTQIEANEAGQETASGRAEKPAAFPLSQESLIDEQTQIEEPAVRASKPKANSKADTTGDAVTGGNPVANIIADPGKPIIVTRNLAKKLPQPNTDFTPKEQKDLFVAIVLPLALAANEEIVQRRMAIKRAAANNDLSSLKKWARLYRIDDDGALVATLKTQLLKRADEIPVPIVLAQAAVESGWGTSRFAQQGNALFGQWAWDKSQGMEPLEASNDRAVVRSFPNLFGSVRAYMHNLNTHLRYAEFRQKRLSLANQNDVLKANHLVEYLNGYAEIGYEYVIKLRLIIRSNDFAKYANATLQ